MAGLLLVGARRAPAIHNVNPADAEKLLRDVGVVLLDVRTPEEFSKGFIPGARLIPLAELERRRQELPKDKTQPLLLYCRTDNRSRKAAHLLYQSGYKDIYILSGGFEAWKASQKPVQMPPGK